MRGEYAAGEFRASDVIRDRGTVIRFTAVIGLQMGQILPQAFISLMLPVIYRENGWSAPRGRCDLKYQ